MKDIMTCLNVKTVLFFYLILHNRTESLFSFVQGVHYTYTNLQYIYRI